MLGSRTPSGVESNSESLYVARTTGSSSTWSNRESGPCRVRRSQRRQICAWTVPITLPARPNAPACGQRLPEFDEIRVTVGATGLSDEEIRRSAMDALRAGNFEIAGTPKGA